MCVDEGASCEGEADVVVVGVSHGFDGLSVPDGWGAAELEVASVVVGAGLSGPFFDVSDGLVLGAGVLGQSPDVVVVVVVLDGFEEVVDFEVVVVVLDGAEVVVVVVVEDAEVDDGASTPQACWTAEFTTVASGADALVVVVAEAELHAGELDVSWAEANDGAASIAPPAVMTPAVKIPVMRLFMGDPSIRL